MSSLVINIFIGVEASPNNIKQYYVNCDTPEAKYCSIANKFDVVTIGLALIFCHTRKMPAGWWRR